MLLLRGVAFIQEQCLLVYHKIPIINPELKFVQKAFLVGLFPGELIFGGACHQREFCDLKWDGLGNKNSLQH